MKTDQECDMFVCRVCTIYQLSRPFYWEL